MWHVPTLRRVEQLMGTPVRLDVHTDLSMIDQAADEAFGWLRRVDALFSTSRADSQ